jgi:hypothetical protein
LEIVMRGANARRRDALAAMAMSALTMVALTAGCATAPAGSEWACSPVAGQTSAGSSAAAAWNAPPPPAGGSGPVAESIPLHDHDGRPTGFASVVYTYVNGCLVDVQLDTYGMGGREAGPAGQTQER